MNLSEFKKHIESFPKRRIFEFGLSDPFSWRGSYDEVAFEILIDNQMTREQVLDSISKAYTNEFYGYKGGSYRYEDYTPVNFESGGSRSYTDGGYCADMISQLEGAEKYQSQEDRLIKLAFK